MIDNRRRRLCAVVTTLAAVAACSSVTDQEPSTQRTDGIDDMVDVDTADPTSAAPGSAMTPADLAESVGDAVWRVDVDDCGVASSGSAFAISDSTLLTNWHVVEFDFEPTVTSRDGTVLDGRVVGYSTSPDIAVIEVADGSLVETVEFVPPDDLREGDPVVSIGYPVPYVTFTVAPGWVTSFVEEDGERIGIVSDESSDYGSSGGPLFDLQGRVVGVVTEFTPEEGLQPNGVSYTTVVLADVIDEILADPQQLETDCAGSAYGTDADLDALWDACAEGRFWACDSLYLLASAGTDYADFAETCGDLGPTGDDYCTDIHDAGIPFEFGDDPLLDVEWSACESGDADSCDRLYLIAPIESRYEEFGATCGDRLVGAEESCDDLM
ncbi:MAG: S1C family serine protease [Ilumatobacteraceae bacterium]